VDFWGWVNGAGTHLHINDGWIILPNTTQGTGGLCEHGVFSVDLEIPDFSEGGNTDPRYDAAVLTIRVIWDGNHVRATGEWSWGGYAVQSGEYAGWTFSRGHMFQKCYFRIYRERSTSRPYIRYYGHFDPVFVLPAPTQAGQVLVSRFFNADGEVGPPEINGGLWWNPEAYPPTP
jgi:hypothetical protein